MSLNLVVSDCLSTDTLTSIGFGSTQSLATYTAATVCVDLFNTSGSCVPEADVKAKLEADNKNFEDSVNIFTYVSSALSTLADTLSSTSTTDSNSIKSILTSLNNTKDGCIAAWSTIQQGITCYLASGEASSNSSVDTSVSVNINTSNDGSNLLACMDYIDAVCLLTAGTSISSTVTVTDTSFLSNETDYKSSCEILQANYSCTTDECMATKYDTIINVFFKPYDYGFFPSESIFTSITDKLSSIAEDVSSWFSDFFSRRLLDESDVVAVSSTSGIDASAYGDDSGVAKVTSGIRIISCLVMISMALLHA